MAVCLGTITFAPGAVLPRSQLISLGENHIIGKEKTTLFGVILMRSQVLYQLAQHIIGCMAKKDLLHRCLCPMPRLPAFATWEKACRVRGTLQRSVLFQCEVPSVVEARQGAIKHKQLLDSVCILRVVDSITLCLVKQSWFVQSSCSLQTFLFQGVLCQKYSTLFVEVFAIVDVVASHLSGLPP